MVVADVLGPDPEAVRKLYAEYNMTPEGVRQDVIGIRQWMAKQPHLPVIPPSKNDEINFWIEGLLRYTKNSVERSKEAIDHYFKGKLLYNNWNNVNDFRAYMHSAQFDNLYMLLLPKVTPDGCRIMLYGVNTEDVTLFRLEDFFHRMATILDIQQKAGIDFMGLRVVIYLRHATLNHLTLFDLPFLKKVFKVARKAYPIRIRHSHIIYPPGFVDVALKVIRPFLPKKIMSRVTIHKDVDSLQDVIPKENLPEDLGGALPTMQELHEMWRNRIIDHRDWFMESKGLVPDESKRPVDKEELNKYGKDGTFRQLSLD